MSRVFLLDVSDWRRTGRPLVVVRLASEAALFTREGGGPAIRATVPREDAPRELLARETDGGAWCVEVGRHLAAPGLRPRPPGTSSLGRFGSVWLPVPPPVKTLPARRAA